MFQVWFNELIFILDPLVPDMNQITWNIWVDSYRGDVREQRNFYNWN